MKKSGIKIERGTCKEKAKKSEEDSKRRDEEK